jgi:hypothetical protein
MFDNGPKATQKPSYPDVKIVLENGGALEVGDLAVRDFNFGQDVDAQQVRVSLTFSRDGFAGAMREYVDETMQGHREMAANSSSEVYGMTKELHDIDFPAVESLLEHPAILNSLVTSSVVEPQNYLERLLPSNENTFRFVINSVESVEVSGNEVTLRCLCYERAEPDSGITGSF